MYNIPVLFIFFNRKETALKAFGRIKAAKPAKLYLSQDGPRAEEGEAEKATVAEVRSAITNLIDWDCEVHTHYAEQNQGCALGVKTAIDWLFDTEECGVILEDDCVVADSFFPFMEEILTRYKDDQRIGMVAGCNPIGSYRETQYSYFFSRYKSCWGWGTWKRAWENMDLAMEWRDKHCDDIIANSGYYGQNKRKWQYQLKCIDNKYVSAWDWQWYFTLASQNQLCVYPAQNLVSNIGNGHMATHTSFGPITYESHDLDFPLKAPAYVCPNRKFDAAFLRKEKSLKQRIHRSVPNKLKRKLKDLIKAYAIHKDSRGKSTDKD
jgi:hypothetical protein